jgi:surfeit locus 1 family protein
MRVAGFVFAPRLWPTLAYALLLPLLLTLGFWQMDRAEQKRTSLAERAEAFRAPVLELGAVKPTLDADEYRRVRATGEYDTEHQFYLDNRVKDDQVGYRVLTPLKLEGRDGAVLVDRGFIPIVGSRDSLPTPPPIESEDAVTGRVGRGPSVGIRLGAPSDNHGEWPRRVQYMDMAYMDEQLDYPLDDYLLIEGSLSTDTVARRDVRDAWRFGPERHDGYAFQWFSLAFALTTIWVVVNTRRAPRRGKNG